MRSRFHRSEFAASQPGSLSFGSPGYFFGSYGPWYPWAAGSNSVLSGGANVVVFNLMYIPFAMSIGHLTVTVASVDTVASKFASFGLYDLTNKLVLQATVNVSVGQPTGNITTAITPVTIQPGFYFYAWTTNSTVATFAVGVNSNIFNNLGNNFGPNRTGTGSATAGGILPATNAPSIKANETPNMCLFEP